MHKLGFLVTFTSPERLLTFLCIIWTMFDYGELQRSLRMLGLQPMTGQGWTGGEPCVVASNMALEDVNANQDILSGYRLEYEFVDTKVKNPQYTYQDVVF